MGKIILHCNGSLPICKHRTSSSYKISSERPIRISHMYSQISLPMPFLIFCPLLCPLYWVLPYTQCFPLSIKSPFLLTLSWSREVSYSNILLLVLCLIKLKSVQFFFLLSHKALQKTGPSAFFHR